MRVLLVSNVNPTGKATGAQMRLTAVARGLAQTGTVDYLQWGSRPWRRRVPPEIEVPATAPFARRTLLLRHTSPGCLRKAHELLWLSGLHRPSDLPYAVASAPVPGRQTIETLLRSRARYDLIWCLELTSAYAVLGALGRIPLVVDVDAVPHLERQSGVPTALPSKGGSLDAQLSERFARRDRDAWRTWIARLGRDATTITFANPVEAAQFDLANAITVPNGCHVPPFRGVRGVAERPVLAFVGWMGYEANADAAHYLATEITAALRDVLGTDFEVRLIGSAPPAIRQLGRDPNVTVAGYVDDLEAALAGADVVVVPVRKGAGTRIKVIEAFASQVPVVSTTFGSLGIDATDGTHLVLADDARSFAVACKRVLVDANLRKRLVTEAYALVSRQHDWAVIEGQVAGIATAAVAQTMT